MCGARHKAKKELPERGAFLRLGLFIPVDDHVPAGLAEGDLILLGDLIQHAAGGQRDGEVALIAAAALDHADEGIQLGVERGGFILDGDGPGLLAAQTQGEGGHGIPLPMRMAPFSPSMAEGRGLSAILLQRQSARKVGYWASAPPWASPSPSLLQQERTFWGSPAMAMVGAMQ